MMDIWQNVCALFSYYLGLTDKRDLPLLEKKYKGYRWYPFSTERSIDELETFKSKESDIYVITYPKSGTHWIMEVVSLVLADGIPEQIDRTFEETPLETIFIRSVYQVLCGNTYTTTCQEMTKAPDPRLLISHMPLSFVPPSAWEKKSRIIYVARSLKDAATSLFTFQKQMNKGPIKVKQTFPELLDAYLAGELPYNGWAEHVKEYWDVRDRENVLFLTYEEMQTDLRDVVRQVSQHLGHPVTEDAMQRILTNSEINKMRTNQNKTMTNARKGLKMLGTDFMVTGVSGKWKKCFTVEQSEIADKFIEQKLRGYEELSRRLDIERLRREKVKSESSI